MTEWILLGVALLLVLACGLFVAAEFGFVTVDRATVERAAAGGDRRAVGTLRALRSLSTQLSGAQLGITITNLAIGFLAEPALAQLLVGPLRAVGLPPATVAPIALTVALVVANVVTMLFGELVPKNLAIAKPLAVSLATSTFQRAFTTVMRWPIRLLNGSANAIVRALGVEPQEELRSVRTPEEITSLVRRSARHGVLDDATATLVERSIAFGDKSADDIMTPRVRLQSLDQNDTVAAIIEAARRTGHSRFPVVDADADSVTGMVHIKHAVAVEPGRRAQTLVRQVMQPPVLVPDTLELDPLLAMLRQEGLQMAVVIDEYGGTAGVVTLEDLLEEIVGEIADEHDRVGVRARQEDSGSWHLSGLLRPDEVAQITGIALPEGEHYDTLAGLVLERIGSLPDVGDSVQVTLPRLIDLDGNGPDEVGEFTVTLTVERLDGRRIDRILLSSHDDLNQEDG
ncbi:hemolysin family protein [Microlunatus panaciterrae]|uniref:CBS domain containing-hemolysin-like protein n=1 Tax=Microlunatus panaciterrae TaxID=400768 RepID=A0ABS2RJQ5_9ACTN|nr:hemolysin family protein [Microlunatus panaciterrae]MBM7799243.1 CBS domain containing-hemolysin-like protein [Microlunatus panaciterrae]